MNEDSMLKEIVTHFHRKCYDVIDDAMSGKLPREEAVYLTFLYHKFILNPFLTYESFIRENTITDEDIFFYLCQIKRYFFKYDNGSVRDLERSIISWNKDIENKTRIKIKPD